MKPRYAIQIRYHDPLEPNLCIITGTDRTNKIRLYHRHWKGCNFKFNYWRGTASFRAFIFLPKGTTVEGDRVWHRHYDLKNKCFKQFEVYAELSCFLLLPPKTTLKNALIQAITMYGL
jgi:hypothetical protein